MHLGTGLIFFVFSVQCFTVEGWLLFPASTVYQITAAVSTPVELKDMKLFIDWGLQVNYILPFSLANFYNIPKWPGISRQQTRAIDYNKYTPLNGSHPSDATAGEVYMALEDLMIEAGFHETCLLKSVCELAQHPFDLGEENLLAEVFNFILSPSIHNSFGDNESAYKHAYEAAERYGASGIDCDYVYPECHMAFINIISRVDYD